MKNWEELDENGVCQSTRDFEDVARVCEKLDIPYSSVEFVKEYQERVFSKFLADYSAGLTPNPDVLCNREIKFDVLLQKTKSLGGEYLATGHYCQVGWTDPFREGQKPGLFKGLDANKDQSYFLNAIDGSVLEHVLFPIGDLPKSRVRELAKEADLKTHDKKDSTGICFIGERNFRPFLAQYLQAQPGPFQTLDGKPVGQHHGSAYYTLGQRRGLGLGGEGDRWFVVDKDMTKNIVFVERGQDHPALYSNALLANQENWISGLCPELPLRATAKVRYRQTDQACEILRDSSGMLKVVFDEPQRAVTPGQSAVFYTNDLCLGGAVIRSRLQK